MKTEYLTLSATGKFSKFMVDFAEHRAIINKILEPVVGEQNFEAAISARQSFDAANRSILKSVLKEQYASLPLQEAVSQNIEKLGAPTTYTVSCGHQLNIFGGPLYVFYKIASVIALARYLQTKYPAFHFVPVHWMATEDHDVAEISTVHLFGKQLIWPTSQTGATGLLQTADLQPLLTQIPDLPPAFATAYTNYGNLADATRYYLHEIFGPDGLLVLDAAHPRLKQLLIPVLQDEISHQSARRLIAKADAEMLAAGYEPQVHARDINLFYLMPGRRERIVPTENEQFAVLNTNIKWSKAEVLHHIEMHPELFSPNVVMRPLYSQLILPDVAFVGGPAELAYWLQLPYLFKYHGVPYPVLMPRLFALLINAANYKKMQKLQMQTADLFKPEHILREQLVQRAGLLPDFENLLYAPLAQGVKAIETQVQAIDPTLVPSLQAEYAKIYKQLQGMAHRVEKAAERRLETDIQSLKGLLEKLFPGNGLQERSDGWLQYYINVPDFKHHIYNLYNPQHAAMAISYLSS